jgi:argininosuccinate lyase
MADVALSYQQVPLFNAVDTIKDCLAIATGVICTMKPKPDNLMKVRTYS